MDETEVRTASAVERAAVPARLQSVISDVDGIVMASADPNGDDEHDPEGSTVAFERARPGALSAGARASIDDLDRALARLDDGTYGWCARCGEHTTPDRSAALPAVELCAACVGGPRSDSGTSNRSLIQGVMTAPCRTPPPKASSPKRPPRSLKEPPPPKRSSPK